MTSSVYQFQPDYDAINKLLDEDDGLRGVSYVSTKQISQLVTGNADSEYKRLYLAERFSIIDVKDEDRLNGRGGLAFIKFKSMTSRAKDTDIEISLAWEDEIKNWVAQLIEVCPEDGAIVDRNRSTWSKLGDALREFCGWMTPTNELADLAMNIFCCTGMSEMTVKPPPNIPPVEPYRTPRPSIFGTWS